MFQKNTKTRRHTLLILAILALVMIGTLLTLEKTGVTDFYTRSGQNEASTPTQQFSDIKSAKPTNTVDYGPAKDDDNVVIPDKNPNVDVTANENPELSATITSTRKNTDNTAYLIRVAVAGTDSGSCKATMTKGSKILTTSTDISLSAGQYSCTNLEFPLSSLDESGIWNVVVTVTDKTGATTSTNAEVIL